MEKIILRGKIPGKKARGRQRITFLQRIAEGSWMSGIELAQCKENRNGTKMAQSGRRCHKMKHKKKK